DHRVAFAVLHDPHARSDLPALDRPKRLGRSMTSHDDGRCCGTPAHAPSWCLRAPAIAWARCELVMTMTDEERDEWPETQRKAHQHIAELREVRADLEARRLRQSVEEDLVTKWKREHVEDDLRQLHEVVHELRTACDELRNALAVMRDYIDHRW